MKRGFTLLELTIVSVVLGVLAAIGIGYYPHAVERGREAEAYSALALIASAENSYRVEYNTYVDTLTLLDVFKSVPTSKNFSFSVPDTSVNGYGQATRIDTSGGSNSYYLCFGNGKRAPCVGSSSCTVDCSNP